MGGARAVADAVCDRDGCASDARGVCEEVRELEAEVQRLRRENEELRREMDRGGGAASAAVKRTAEGDAPQAAFSQGMMEAIAKV